MASFCCPANATLRKIPKKPANLSRALRCPPQPDCRRRRFQPPPRKKPRKKWLRFVAPRTQPSAKFPKSRRIYPVPSAAHPNPTAVVAASNPHRVRSSVRNGFVLSPRELNPPQNSQKTVESIPCPPLPTPTRQPCRRSNPRVRSSVRNGFVLSPRERNPPNSQNRESIPLPTHRVSTP